MIQATCSTLIRSLIRHPADWLWGTRCAVCTRRWKRSVIVPSQTRGWQWIEWSSQGLSTVERCFGWRTYLRSSTQIHINRWRNSERFVLFFSEHSNEEINNHFHSRKKSLHTSTNNACILFSFAHLRAQAYVIVQSDTSGFKLHLLWQFIMSIYQ